MHIVLLNKRWKYQQVPTSHLPRIKNPTKNGRKYCRGVCWSPDAIGRKILVDKNLEGEEALEVDIHEMLHACFWFLDEEYVFPAAKDLAKALTRIGYKKVDFGV